MLTVVLLVIVAASVALYESDKERAVMKKETIVRYSEPNKFDQLPYGTELLVTKDKNTKELFKQVSMDDDKPCWHSMGIVHEA